jgi:TRAP-type mannitol/chloroaromatic compound transport system permease large subunit
MSLITENLAPIMFGSLIVFLLTGFPVAFSLAACGMFFGFIAIELNMMTMSLLQALPLRLVGIMQNDTLLAIPFFTFMGLILERSGMAEDLLETVGQVFGPIRGGVAFAVIIVGAMLAATTGVVAASVISMGLISLPIMLRYGYNRSIATGAITASGTLAQIIPPSLVLIVIADQLGRSVGDMYLAAFIPGFMLVGVFCLFIAVVAVVRPAWVPALPPEARIYREPGGSSGHASLAVIFVVAVAIGVGFGKYYPQILTALGSTSTNKPPTDEVIVMGLTVGVFSAFAISSVFRLLGLKLLSQLAQRVTFVLIPPLLLIFLVLGTIFLGVATPTEGGAMGAVGALVLAGVRKQLNGALMVQALHSTAKLSSFVIFVLIGSTIFSLTFQGIDGPIWVEHLFTSIPGGQLGFLIFVNTLIFFLGCFLDFFEIAFILLPLLGPVAEKLDIDLVYFGVLIAMNIQTAFLTPPFGFALFYLRSVAPDQDYVDRVTKKVVAKVTTAEIYKGSVAFVMLQLTMVVALIAFPAIALYALGPKQKLDTENVKIELQDGYGDKDDEEKGEDGQPKEEDPAAAFMRQMQEEGKK